MLDRPRPIYQSEVDAKLKRTDTDIWGGSVALSQRIDLLSMVFVAFDHPDDSYLSYLVCNQSFSSRTSTKTLSWEESYPFRLMIYLRCYRYDTWFPVAEIEYPISKFSGRIVQKDGSAIIT